MIYFAVILYILCFIIVTFLFDNNLAWIALCCVQQAADYCYNSATKIQELEADNLCNEMGAAGQMMKTRPIQKGSPMKRNIEQAIVSRVPKNTLRSTNWGMRIFLKWCEERSIETPVIDVRYTCIYAYCVKLCNPTN